MCMENHLFVDRLTLRYNRRGGIDVECSPLVRDIGVRSPVATDLSRKKQVVTASLPNARQKVRVSRVLGDEHYKRMPRVKVGVAR